MSIFNLISLEQKQQIEYFIELILKWNSKVNLVGFKNREDILNYLISDSLFLADFFKKSLVFKSKKLTFIDLGAGAGLPGIPFRIIHKAGDYYLVEIRKKRAIFLKNVIFKLQLSNTYVLQELAENLFKYHYSADIIIARAFKPYLQVLKIAYPLLKKRKGRVVILANKPKPKKLPSNWQLETVYSYQVEEKSRYFWSFKPNI